MDFWNERSRNILSAFWLRPYTALIRIIEDSILDIPSKDTGFSADFGCGDGVLSALLMGHRFPVDFSPYISVPVHSYHSRSDSSSPSHDDYDLFNTSNGLDYYDQNKLSSPQWSIGIDHKSSLLSKARSLNVFSQCCAFDFDDPNICELLTQCLCSNPVNYAYSNSLYWAKNPLPLLTGVANSMNSGGVFQATIVTPQMIKNMTYTRMNQTLPSTASFLDKGRHQHYQSIKNPDEWVHVFKAAGFTDVSVRPYMTSYMAFAVEELDQREHYPYISKMYYSLPLSERLGIKQSWLDHLEELLMKYLDDYEEPSIETCCYFLLSATK